MTVDVSQFHATFLEESGEHLAELERGLLSLEEAGETDFAAIFRAAHSIKGGAATFGFEAIAGFTHVVESVLQNMRDGEIEVDETLTTELLAAVDIISELLDAARESRDDDPADRPRCLAALQAVLDGESTDKAKPAGADKQSTAKAPSAATPVSEMSTEQVIYAISFKPLIHMLATGSDPLNIFRELATLGELDVVVHFDGLPPLDDLAPEDLYLWWELELVTDAGEEAIRDVFLFVEDEAEIGITVIGALGGTIAAPEENSTGTARQNPAATENAANAPAEVVEATPVGERRQTERRNTERRKSAPAPKENAYIRVAIDKVDDLINLVGELVTTNAMVEQQTTGVDTDRHQHLIGAVTAMAGHTRNLQEAIMAIRMMPIDFAFSRFPRMVRDTSQKLGKEVRLETTGNQTELDKTVIERMTDPLTHLVRNAIDHGLEQPDERIAAGKPAEGVVELAAYHRGGNVVIDIRDDGRGLNRAAILAKARERNLIGPEEEPSDDDVWQMIFQSGFSTAAEVTDVSGRGVGMDVVMKNIKALGGNISIKSEVGKGSCFTISLPLTLAIVDGMATRVGDNIYIIPLLNIMESIRPEANQMKSMQDDVEVMSIRGEFLPFLRLADAFHVKGASSNMQVNDGIAMIVEAEHHRIALFVDELLGERQVVIKNIEDNYRMVEGISGATILGDGNVAFILDLPGIVRLATREGRFSRTPAPAAARQAPPTNEVAPGMAPTHADARGPAMDGQPIGGDDEDEPRQPASETSETSTTNPSPHHPTQEAHP